MKFNLNSYYTEQAFDISGNLVDSTKKYLSQNPVIGSFINPVICPLASFNLSNDSSTQPTNIKQLIGYVNTLFAGNAPPFGNCYNVYTPIYADSSNLTIGTQLSKDRIGTAVPDCYFGFSVSNSSTPYYIVTVVGSIVTSIVLANCTNGNSGTTGQAQMMVINDAYGTTNPTLFSVENSNWSYNSDGQIPIGNVVNPVPSANSFGYTKMIFNQYFNNINASQIPINITTAPNTLTQIFIKRGDGSGNGLWYLLLQLSDSQSGIINIDIRGGDKFVIQSVPLNYSSSLGAIKTY